MRTLWDLLMVWDVGPRREADTGAGARGSGAQALRAWTGGAGLLVATPPGPPCLPLGRVQPQEEGAGPVNQRFSDCIVSRTPLGSGDSESVRLR